MRAASTLLLSCSMKSSKSRVPDLGGGGVAVPGRGPVPFHVSSSGGTKPDGKMVLSSKLPHLSSMPSRIALVKSAPQKSDPVRSDFERSACWKLHRRKLAERRLQFVSVVPWNV